MEKYARYKNSIKSDRQLIERCGEVIKSANPGAEVVLYGSRARGDFKNDSDYDFLIIVEGDVTTSREDQIRDSLYPIELETGCVLTVMVVSREQWLSPVFQAMPFYANVSRDGIVL